MRVVESLRSSSEAWFCQFVVSSCSIVTARPKARRSFDVIRVLRVLFRFFAYGDASIFIPHT
jgi:hypothetical protein